jgi:uncharacterized membrane protein HdeD (DUF308 family)
MQDEVKGASWAIGLWGAFSIIFGALVLAWPGISLKAFLIVLGIYLLTSGAVMAIGSLVNRHGHWVGGAIIGALSAIAGLYVFANPGISALAILTVIAIWSIAVGALQLVAGFAGNNNWWMILAGAVQTLFGFYIFANPGGGALALVWLVGLSIITAGLLLIVAAFKGGDLSRQLGRS